MKMGKFLAINKIMSDVCNEFKSILHQEVEWSIVSDFGEGTFVTITGKTYKEDKVTINLDEEFEYYHLGLSYDDAVKIHDISVRLRGKWQLIEELIKE